jgi:hypothetical protein
MGKIGHHLGGRLGLTNVNGTHFFMDIGSSANDVGTKRLEDNGWKGVCASPFPDVERSCKTISSPVVPKDGEQVSVEDCTQTTGVLQVLMSAVATTHCPQVMRAGVGIAEVLDLSKAPSIIDYLALDTSGSELPILKRFPFEKFCVRAWTVRHGEKADKADIQQLLESRNCHVKDVGDVYWARCSCSDFSETLLQVNGPHLHQHFDKAKFLKEQKHALSEKMKWMNQEKARAEKDAHEPNAKKQATQSSVAMLQVDAEPSRHSGRHRKKKSTESMIASSGTLQQDADPPTESIAMLGGSSGLSGALLRRSFA